jgi:hypothetical protein
VLVLAVTATAAMRAAIERGDLDEAARQGALAGPAVVERALAARDRPTQLAAIAAATLVEDRAELLAPLARLAGGADRRTAIPAAEAARTIAGDLARRDRSDDLAAEDVAAWRAMWAELALRTDRWIELRIAALETAVALDPAGVGVDLAAALRDGDPAFRRAVVSSVALPVPPAAHAALAGAIIHDVDPLTALEAAQSLCLSLEVSARPAAILDALGPDGLARIRALVGQRADPSIGEARSRGVGTPPALPVGRGSSPVGSTGAAIRDAGRCLRYSGRGSPGSTIHRRAGSSRRSAQ